MNTRKTILLLMLFVVVGYFHCESDSATAPSKTLQEFTKDASATVAVPNGVQVIKIINPFGGVIITGSSDSTSADVYLYKKIKAISQDVAAEHFADMNAIFSQQNDEWILTVQAPYNTSELEYDYCSLSIQLPYKMACEIAQCAGAVFVDQMDAEITVNAASNTVEIDHLYGACTVDVAQDINVRMQLADSSFCRLHSSKGDITLNIQADANATVNMQASAEIVSTNLIFASQNQTGFVFAGVLGTGTAEITLQAEDGNIYLIGND